jgi:hypothetical protein
LKSVLLIAIVAVAMIGVMVPSSFAETYFHNDPVFSIDLPSGWIIDSEWIYSDSVKFINGQYGTLEIIIEYVDDVGSIVVSDYEFKEILIEGDEQYCLNSSFEEDGFVCSDFKSQNFEIETSPGTPTTYIHFYSYVKKYLGYSTNESFESINLIRIIDGNLWAIESHMMTRDLTSIQIQNNVDKSLKIIESINFDPIAPEPIWAKSIHIDDLFLQMDDDSWEQTREYLDTTDKNILDYRIYNYKENNVAAHNAKVTIKEFSNYYTASNYLKELVSNEQKFEKLPVEFTTQYCHIKLKDNSMRDFSTYACVNENYIIIIETTTLTAEANELAKIILDHTLDLFPVNAQQKIEEEKRISEEKRIAEEKRLAEEEKRLAEEKKLTEEINNAKTALDEGEIISYLYISNIKEFKDLKLLENNDYDLLQINYVFQSDTGNSAMSYPFGSLRATSEFSKPYDSWASYNYLSTEDVPWAGTTIPGSDEWDVECPSYLGKNLNPNIPYTLTACFEIPKEANYFYFEGRIFSKSVITPQDNLKAVMTQLSPESDGGGCLIATATYGSELAPQVQQLRELRDNQLLQTESGTAFMSTFNDIYYSFSPTIADYERENPYFKEAVNLAITPMISTLSLMENAESESEVLSIGISVIALNLGMYLGVPAIVIVGLRRII